MRMPTDATRSPIPPTRCRRVACVASTHAQARQHASHELVTDDQPNPASIHPQHPRASTRLSARSRAALDKDEPEEVDGCDECIAREEDPTLLAVEGGPTPAPPSVHRRCEQDAEVCDNAEDLSSTGSKRIGRQQWQRAARARVRRERERERERGRWHPRAMASKAALRSRQRGQRPLSAFGSIAMC